MGGWCQGEMNGWGVSGKGITVVQVVREEGGSESCVSNRIMDVRAGRMGWWWGVGEGYRREE